MARTAQRTALPSKTDTALAAEGSRVLLQHRSAAGPVTLRVPSGARGKTVHIPAPAVRMLGRILQEMARGNAVTLVPVHAEVTSQEAADLLNVSRPTLIQLLDEGKVDYRKVGTHRRVRFDSLIAYKRQLEVDRKKALAELAAYDQELGL